jgi:hypothetical protein
VGEFVGDEAAFLARVRSHQRPLAVFGGVLALAGAAYLAWGILHFDPHGDPRDSPGFDGPIANLAFIFQRGQILVENVEPKTQSEARMLAALARNMAFSAGIMVLQVRLFVGTLAMLAGFILLTVVVERARLLRLIKRLQE